MGVKFNIENKTKLVDFINKYEFTDRLYRILKAEEQNFDSFAHIDYIYNKLLNLEFIINWEEFAIKFVEDDIIIKWDSSKKIIPELNQSENMRLMICKTIYNTYSNNSITHQIGIKLLKTNSLSEYFSPIEVQNILKLFLKNSDFMMNMTYFANFFDFLNYYNSSHYDAEKLILTFENKKFNLKLAINLLNYNDKELENFTKKVIFQNYVSNKIMTELIFAAYLQYEQLL